MTYKEVIKNGLHLELSRKEKYTIKDVKTLIQKGFNVAEAIFIVKCTSIYHDSKMSETLYQDIQDLKIDLMF